MQAMECHGVQRGLSMTNLKRVLTTYLDRLPNEFRDGNIFIATSLLQVQLHATVCTAAHGVESSIVLVGTCWDMLLSGNYVHGCAPQLRKDMSRIVAKPTTIHQIRASCTSQNHTGIMGTD